MTRLRLTEIAGMLFFIILMMGCLTAEKSNKQAASQLIPNKIPVVFDTDCNNELDDQHALAYLLCNSDVFDILGVTVNATLNGGEVTNHYKEAERILKFYKAEGKIPLKTGANAGFTEIRPTIGKPDFDGKEAVDFIIKTINESQDTVVLLPVGKLTNIALAVEKSPAIKNKIRIVWLGSNYPEPGEYNQDNDPEALRYLLSQDVPFEMVTVRYGKPSGTAAVAVTKTEIQQKMASLGPKVDSVEGRHGEKFSCFGDYSLNLFEHIELYENSRSLFDMVAVAILKNESWGESSEVPSPRLDDRNWIDQPDNERKIIVWENFDKDKILTDFFSVMKDPVLTGN